ncbi:hypothetical protein Patl1_15882 [Pistacia atlantica]|uniref:Uncharacterized protein n=1 Tax=Pistacia atlantica TaxID=434234 RepID=A0ACC1B5U7_9ROSI|nr:hypothetical protein Patl1_15882 [Pistacia atlantica]
MSLWKVMSLQKVVPKYQKGFPKVPSHLKGINSPR